MEKFTCNCCWDEVEGKPFKKMLLADAEGNIEDSMEYCKRCWEEGVGADYDRFLNG